MMIDLERRADHADDRELGGRFDHCGDCVEARVEQRALLKQVVARIGGQAQFGEQREHRLALGGVADERDGVLGIVGGIGDANGRHSNRDSHEIVIVEIEKARRSWSRRVLCYKTVPIVGVPYKIARDRAVSQRGAGFNPPDSRRTP